MRTYRAGAVDNARPEPSALRSTSGRCGSHRRAARAARVSGGTEGVNRFFSRGSRIINVPPKGGGPGLALCQEGQLISPVTTTTTTGPPSLLYPSHSSSLSCISSDSESDSAAAAREIIPQRTQAQQQQQQRENNKISRDEGLRGWRRCGHRGALSLLQNIFDRGTTLRQNSSWSNG